MRVVDAAQNVLCRPACQLHSPLSFRFSILLFTTTSAPITLALSNLLATTSTDILVWGERKEGVLRERREEEERRVGEGHR